MNRSFVKSSIGGDNTEINNNNPNKQQEPQKLQKDTSVSIMSVANTKSDSEYPSLIELKSSYYDLLLYILNSHISYFNTFEGYRSYNLIPPSDFLESILEDNTPPSRSSVVDINNINVELKDDFNNFIKEYYKGYQNAKDIEDIEDIEDINDIIDLGNSTELSGGGIENVEKLVIKFCKKILNRVRRKPTHAQVHTTEDDNSAVPVSTAPVSEEPPYRKIKIVSSKPPDTVSSNLLTNEISDKNNKYMFYELNVPNFTYNLNPEAYVDIVKYSSRLSDAIEVENTIRSINNSFPKPQPLSEDKVNQRKNEIMEKVDKSSPQTVPYQFFSSLRPVNAMTIDNDDTPECMFIHTAIYLYYKTDEDYYFDQIREEEEIVVNATRTTFGGRKKYTKRKGAKLRLKTIHSKRQRPPVSSNK